jgi:hypothetical protein
MAISVNWQTRVIDIPQADLVLLSGSRYDFPLVSYFKTQARLAEASEEGIVFDQIVNYVPPFDLGDTILAPAVQIINGYTCTFEDGMWAAVFSEANTNIQNETNVNQVSIRPNNSTGLALGVKQQEQLIRDAMQLNATDGEQSVDGKLNNNFAATAGLYGN